MSSEKWKILGHSHSMIYFWNYSIDMQNNYRGTKEDCHTPDFTSNASLIIYKYIARQVLNTEKKIIQYKIFGFHIYLKRLLNSVLSTLSKAFCKSKSYG